VGAADRGSPEAPGADDGPAAWRGPAPPRNSGRFALGGEHPRAGPPGEVLLGPRGWNRNHRFSLPFDGPARLLSADAPRRPAPGPRRAGPWGETRFSRSRLACKLGDAGSVSMSGRSRIEPDGGHVRPMNAPPSAEIEGRGRNRRPGGAGARSDAPARASSASSGIPGSRNSTRGSARGMCSSSVRRGGHQQASRPPGRFVEAAHRGRFGRAARRAYDCGGKRADGERRPPVGRVRGSQPTPVPAGLRRSRPGSPARAARVPRSSGSPCPPPAGAGAAGGSPSGRNRSLKPRGASCSRRGGVRGTGKTSRAAQFPGNFSTHSA